jgi:hypothetical protein
MDDKELVAVLHEHLFMAADFDTHAMLNELAERLQDALDREYHLRSHQRAAARRNRFRAES